MSAPSTSESQPSYLKSIEEKPNYQAVPPKQLLDESQAIVAMKNLAIRMAQQEGSSFQQSLNSLRILFEKGYSYLLITYPLLLRKLMNHFTKLGKELRSNQNPHNQLKMIFVLSIIAQLVRNNPKFYYPFTRKFLITVFSIDLELLSNKELRNQILAILATIYENLSRQVKLISKYGIQNNLKTAVLTNYQFISEVGTLKIINKTITNLVGKGINFTTAEFHKYKIMDTVSRIVSKSQIDLFLVKMRLTMMGPLSKGAKKVEGSKDFEKEKQGKSETEMNQE